MVPHTSSGCQQPRERCYTLGVHSSQLFMLHSAESIGTNPSRAAGKGVMFGPTLNSPKTCQTLFTSNLLISRVCEIWQHQVVRILFRFATISNIIWEEISHDSSISQLLGAFAAPWPLWPVLRTEAAMFHFFSGKASCHHLLLHSSAEVMEPGFKTEWRRSKRKSTKLHKHEYHDSLEHERK